MVREKPGENLWRLNLGWVTAEELEQAPRYCPIFFSPSLNGNDFKIREKVPLLCDCQTASPASGIPSPFSC